MKRRFSGPLHWLGHTCTGFGRYLMNLQSGQAERGYCVRCTGSPTHDEAQQDFAAMDRQRMKGWTHS